MANETDFESYVPLDSMNETKTTIVSDLFGGAQAAVADLAGSTFNSLVPEKYEVNTRDMVARLGDNALRVYDEHPDAVHAASFVAGVLVPSGLALKGMGALRSGMKGVNWFSEAGKIDQMGKINTLIQEGKMISTEYDAATRALYLRNIANTVVDNAAMELAIVTTMSAHPMMEDYVKDPLKNFGIGMMIGTAFSAPFSHIAARADVKKLGMEAYEGALGELAKGTKVIERTEDMSVQLAQHQNNIDNWSNFVSKSGASADYNDLTKSLAESFIRSSKAEQIQTWEKMASPELRALPIEMRDSLIGKIVGEPERFAGINSVKFASAKEIESFLKPSYEKLTGSTVVGSGIPLTKGVGTAGALVKDDMIYSPTFDAFMRKKDLSGYGVAADLVADEKELVKGLNKYWHLTPNYDAGIEKLGETAAYIDADYLRKLKAVDTMDMAELKNVAIHPEDGAMLNAVFSRLQKELAAGEDISDFKAVLTQNKPSWEKIEASMMQNEVQRIQTSGGSVGVKASYAQDLKSSVEDAWHKYDLLSAGVSHEANSLLRGWKAGSGMNTLRNAIDDAFRPSGFAPRGATESAKRAVKELYNSSQSQALRNSLSQLADAEGYVYLYRGLKGNAFSASALESFTTNAAKAAEFGTPKLYKVKVTDVFGGIRDIAGRAGYERSTEVLVMSHTREGLEKLPIAQLVDAIPPEIAALSNYGTSGMALKGYDKSNLKNLIANSYDDFKNTTSFEKFVEDYKATSGVKEVSALESNNLKVTYEAQAKKYIQASVDDYVKSVNEFQAAKSLASTKEQQQAGFFELQEALLKQKEADIISMIKMEIPLEVIRTRTNTPIDAIKAVAQGTPISEVSSRLYSNADEVGNYLAAGKRSLVVGTTASKIPVAQMRAQIHQQMLGEADGLIKQTILSSSSSAVLRDMAGFLFNKDNLTRKSLLRDAMAKINPASGGSKFWQSSDFWTRDMGDAGYIITELGKDSTHLSNKYTNQLVKPITEHFAAIVKDPAAVIEANTARELNASLRGYRELRDGQFFVQDAEVPFKLLPSGEQVRNMVPAKWKGQEFTLSTPSVRKAYEEMQKAGRELYEMNNSARKILGQPAINDLGFWMPALNPRDKYITYVVNKTDSTTMMLYGRTPQELVSAENAYTAMSKEAPGTWEFVRKGADQARYNIVAARHDPMFMQVADVGALHGGSSQSAVVPTSINMFTELANGYEHYIGRTVANHLELQYSDVIQQLDRLSDSAKALTAGQPVSAVQKAINNIEDVGSIAKNTLLGRSNLKEFTGWQDAQNGIQTSIEMTLQTINNVMSPMLTEVKGFFGKGKVRSDAEWEKLIDDMEIRGIPNPFAGMDDALAKERYNVEKLSQAPNLTARVVALSNGLAATALLKVMELGQPLVNMLSLPILTSAAVQKQFAPEFMGAALEKNFHLSTTRAMYDGMRYLAHPDYQKYKEAGEKIGIFKPVVSEVSDILQLTRSFNPGIMQRVENVISYTKGQDISHFSVGERLTAQFIDITSRPTVWSEQAVREISFATGVSLARKAYPNLGEAGVITFARNFVDTAVGNYNPAQRPTVFQGTIGSAMGLFQTYMVTLGQQIYRKAELRDYKNLMKMALTQSSLFGMKSLPGFNQVSEQIGEHFSDGHIDLTTGMYQAVPEGAADVLLYGLPSNLGPAVYTRGDIQPRIPNVLGGIQNLAAFNILGQAYDSAKILGRATQEMGDKGATQAFAEALSMQSISRPLARISELATGHSVTRKGNEIAGPEEIYSTQGILARVFATRGLREAKAREAQYLDGMYKTLDKEQRSQAMQVLKNHIRSDSLTPEIIERVNEKYMRTGSATGWRSAVNTALQDTDSPGVSAVRNHLAPNSPVNRMIDDVD